MNLQVLVIDDHPLIRIATQHLLDLQADMTCIGCCEDLDSARQMLSEREPDLVICDLQFKNGNAIEFIRETTMNTTSRLVVSSAHRASVYADLCQRAGAHGYLQKSGSPEKMFDVIRKVANDQSGEQFHCESFDPSEDERSEWLASLTNREWEVLTQIGRGHSTKEIAKNLYVSAKTVESHRASLKRKLKIDSKDFLISYAAELCVLGI